MSTISIPSASVANPSSKPYTVYNISIRLPLHFRTLQKRYSDFRALHQALTDQTGVAPPFALPSKSFFTSSVTSPALTEARRQAFEAYLQGIDHGGDARWRQTTAWRAFLSLTATKPSSKAPTVDEPGPWLVQYREMKDELQAARLHLTRRDQAETPKAQHEAGLQAKHSLANAERLLEALSAALRNVGSLHIGEGEVRRRKDLVANAARERDGLQNLYSTMVAKSALDSTIAKAQLIELPSARTTSRRVLGKETDETRALDNQGVLQLQQQFMQEQDADVSALAQAVSRQKELGIQIQEELAVQSDMLGLLDEDVTRVQGKVDIARKRVDRIS